MKVAVIRFPGSNCDQDAFWAMKEGLGLPVDYVWHDLESLAGFDAVYIPGGFSYGDYLRCGAMAARARIVPEIKRLAAQGNPVIGACNGFQILCEMGLLEGALLKNLSQKFVCDRPYLRRENSTSMWTEGVPDVIQIPIAHGEGRYIASEETLKRIEGEGRVAFRYCTASGEVTSDANPNGSVNNIAGIVNPAGNVLGMMPHPERAYHARFGGDDGLAILRALTKVRI